MGKQQTVVRYAAGGVILASLALNAGLAIQLYSRNKAKPAPAPAAEPPKPVPAPQPQPKPPVAAAPEPLRILSTRYDADNSRFEIRFSAPPQPEKAAEFLSVTPPLALNVNSSGDRWYISAGFEPGKFYQFTVKQGLPAAGGAPPLERTERPGFIASELPPRINFLSNGSFFPVSGSVWELPVETVNTGKVKVELSQVYPNRLLDFLQSPWSDCSRSLRTVTLDAPAARNRSNCIALPFDALGLKRVPGVYQLRISSPDASRSDSRLVVLTDLALQAVAGEREVGFAVRSLAGNRPVSGAVVQLYSRKLQPLGEAETDAGGFGKIEFEPLADPDDQPALLVAIQGEDVTYLPFSELNRSDLRKADRGLPVARQAGYGAFLFPERGICRPGETIGVFGYLRDAGKLNAAGGVPLVLEVTAPSGKLFCSRPVTGSASGFYQTGVEIPAGAATGAYSVRLRAPGEDRAAAQCYGSTRFLVGEYVPDQLKMEFRAEKETLAPGETLRVKGRVDYYFGIPLESGPVILNVREAVAEFRPQDWRGFTFGTRAAVERSSARTFRSSGEVSRGAFNDSFEIPELAYKPVLPVEIVAVATARPPAGRSVSGTVRALCHYRDHYLGLQDGGAQGKRRVFRIAAVTPDGKPYELKEPALSGILIRRDWDYRLVEEDGRWNYQWQQFQQEFPARKLALVPEGRGIYRCEIEMPQEGDFTLRVADKAGDLLAETEFWHYAGESGERSRNPSVLAFELDAESCQPGETVQFAFNAPAAGEAVVTAGADRIRSITSHRVKAGRNAIEIPVPADLAQGTYFAGVTVVTDPSDDPKIPKRLSGLVRIPVDQNSRRLDVKLHAPAVSRPGEAVTVRAEVSDFAGQPVPAELQLWAVDRGILALTDWKTPDPWKFFFGEVNCPFRFGDTYRQLYPALQVVDGRIGGGDKLAGFLSPFAAALKAPAVVAMRTVSVPASGSGEYQLQLPDHTGALLLMAIASDKEQTGSAERELVLREPATVQIAAPRAVAPQDEFQLALTCFNHELAQSAADWSITVEGALEPVAAASGKLELAKGERRVVTIPVRASKLPGAVTVRAELKLGGTVVRGSESFTVRPPRQAENRTVIHTVEPGRSATFDTAHPDFDLTFGKAAVEIGSPALSVAGALRWLNEYPYGCLEQTVAGAFPFLAVKPLEEAGILPAGFGADADLKLRSALARIQAMRRYDGCYSMWPGERASWMAGSFFAWHFLLEAEQAGYPLPEEEKRQIVTLLRRYVNDRGNSAEERGYACYLLALADPASAEAPARAVISENPELFSRFLAGAALIRANFAADGARVIGPLLNHPFHLYSRRSGGALDSEERRLGLALWILGDLAPENPAVTRLAALLQQKIRPEGEWGSTQNNAWAALGLSRWAARHAKGACKGTLQVSGQPDRTLDGGSALRADFAVPAKFTVVNSGEAPLYVYVSSRGLPKEGREVAGGFTIRREYFDADGKPVRCCNSGDLLEARITVTAAAGCENIVISDLLPGGLEIEDERLATRNAVFDKRVDSGVDARMLERRDDRFLLFGDIHAGKAVVTYRVRAVQRGRFAIPAVQIESMYRPELKAVSVTDGLFEVK